MPGWSRVRTKGLAGLLRILNSGPGNGFPQKSEEARATFLASLRELWYNIFNYG